MAAFPSGKKVFVAQFRQNGRSRRITIGKLGPLTPDQARNKAQKLLGAVIDGADPIKARREARGVRTFKELSDEFMRLHVAPKRKPRAAEEYGRLLKLHILPSLGSRRITDIRRVDVAHLHGDLSETPQAANRCLALISSIWNWAAKRDEVKAEENPARGTERNPEQGKERFLSSEELARLGDAMRRAETKGLPWNVDETKAGAKHVPKVRKLTVIDAHAIAAIRLLVLTGAHAARRGHHRGTDFGCDGR